MSLDTASFSCYVRTRREIFKTFINFSFPTYKRNIITVLLFHRVIWVLNEIYVQHYDKFPLNGYSKLSVSVYYFRKQLKKKIKQTDNRKQLKKKIKQTDNRVSVWNDLNFYLNKFTVCLFMNCLILTDLSRSRPETCFKYTTYWKSGLRRKFGRKGNSTESVVSKEVVSGFCFI